MKLILSLTLGVVLASGTGTTAWAQEEAPGPAKTIDDALKDQLDQSGLKYGVTSSGNASVVFSLEGNRSQEVFIRGKTETLDGIELREIWSNAGYLDVNPGVNDLIGLLTGGGDETLGAWNLEKNDNGWLAYYSVKLPADLGAADLKSAAQYIAAVADAKEKELFNVDEN